MRLETFFEKFDRLVEAPNAVAKMRELIVQLAVRGKLAPNDSAEVLVNERVEKALCRSTPPP